MRKGRLELWLGVGCVGLVLAIGLGGLYHRRIQAIYCRWRFLHGDKAAAAGAMSRLCQLGPDGERQLRDLAISAPVDELTVISRRNEVVTVRNDRPHRVYVGRPGGAECIAFLGDPGPPERRDGYIRARRWLAQRSDGSVAAQSDPPIVTPHRVLDPVETAEFWVAPAR